MGLVLSWLIMVAVEKFVEHEKAEAFFQSLLIPPQTAPADRFR